ncbi:MAG: AraC family transcriptional regulator [Actinomycetota bacterium]|nr:AraC family transcriptional regulator [Actinomycetota bacterium]
MAPTHGGNQVRAWRPALPGVTEVFHARFTDHCYPMHCHDTWTVLIVDDGAIRYDLERHEHAAAGPTVTVLPPFVPHDGRSARHDTGFTKRVLYLDLDTIGEDLVGAAADRPLVEDRALRSSIAGLHCALTGDDDDLERESRLALVVERVHRRLTRDAAGPRPPSGDAATALRDHLDAHAFERLTLKDTAAALGWNETHLIRSFTAAFGIAPHRYLLSRRIDEARRRLLAGEPASQVAVGVGFFDQAHLHRHFTAHLAITPGRYQRSGRAGA